MRGWLVTLVLVAGVACAVEALSPGGKLEKPIRLLFSVLLLIVLLTPLLTVELPDLIPARAEAAESETARDTVIRTAEGELKKKIARDVGIPREDILVEVGTEGEGSDLRVARVTVTLTGESVTLRDDVYLYLTEHTEGCDVRVAIG